MSCGGIKGLKDTDKIFNGTNVEILDKENISNRNALMNEIDFNLLKPKSVFKRSMIQNSKQRLQNVIIGNGYLKSTVVCDSVSNKRKVKINCDITLNQRYKIDSVFYPVDTLPIAKVLSTMYTIDFLKNGDYIQGKNIILDRDAFIETAHNNGYPFISKDDIVFIVDTTVGNYLVDVHLQIRPSTDSTKYERYRYGSIYINPNFSLESDLPTDTSNMIKKEDYNISAGYDFLNEKPLNKAMYIKEGIIYNKSRSRITSNRLSGLGLFKFVNVKTRVNPDKTLDQFFNLSTYKMESISGEFELNNRPGNFLGMVGKLTYTNKNIFKGAERLDISLSGGLENQFASDKPFININTSDITLETSLTIPFIIMPFKPFKTNRNFIPKTFISLSVNQQRNVTLFSARSLKAKYGFKWNETVNKSSFWVPIDFQWFTLLNTTSEFDSLLVSDPRLEVSFENTFVLGSLYEYVYNKRNKYNPINQLYFKGTIESAGTLLNLFINPKSANQPATVLGTPFAQYLRLTADVRKYWALNIGSLASRFVVGTGFAFGNSSELPYSKQYSIGGANDLRAFGLRRIGPGNYVSQDSTDNQFFDQTGDIKIEFNLEYRFPIYRYFKGAFFVDAGNVWLYESDTRPEGVFQFDNFYNQFAIGTGFGLRFDIEYILLRLDLAFPIRNINDNGNFTWVADKIAIGSSAWLSNNLVYNLGIGYPF